MNSTASLVVAPQDKCSSSSSTATYTAPPTNLSSAHSVMAHTSFDTSVDPGSYNLCITLGLSATSSL